MANAKFTAQEFDEMIADLLSPNSSFVPLCDIAHKELWPKIYRTFQSSPALRQYYSDEDFMQDIFIKLINNVVTGFLLKDGPGGPVNRDYKGFRSWLHRVATNALYDLYARINVKLKHAASDEIDEENLPLIEMEDPFYLEASVQELKNAFDIVITAKNTGIYKTLTWLIQSVLVLKFDFTRIEANKYLIAEFEQKTLWQMYEMLVEYADRLMSWPGSWRLRSASTVSCSICSTPSGKPSGTMPTKKASRSSAMCPSMCPTTLWRCGAILPFSCWIRT